MGISDGEARIDSSTSLWEYKTCGSFSTPVFHHLTDAWDEGGRHTSYTYRASSSVFKGLIASITDPAGKSTSVNEYDTYGNPHHITRADNTETYATYNARGDRLSFTDGRNKTSYANYDQ